MEPKKTGRKPLPDGVKRSKIVSLLLNPHEYETITNLAAANHQSTGSYVRLLLADVLAKQQTAEDEAS